MHKPSRIINWLTIITSLVAFVVVLLLWLRGDEASKKLSELNKEFGQLEKTAADQNKSQTANLARAKRKNEEIRGILRGQTLASNLHDETQGLGNY